MRRALLLLVVAVCLAGVGATMAQDPVKVDPKHYKVEFENDQVRVLRVHLGPKESIPLHEHPQCVLTFLTDAHVKSTLADGKTEERTTAAGSVRYRPSLKHAVENLNDKDFEVIEVEVKTKLEPSKPAAEKQEK
jgi:quercetin dioxygenase-like cupin family protein